MKSGGGSSMAGFGRTRFDADAADGRARAESTR